MTGVARRVCKNQVMSTFHHFLFKGFRQFLVIGLVIDVSIDATARNQTSVVPQCLPCNTSILVWTTEGKLLLGGSEMYRSIN